MVSQPPDWSSEAGRRPEEGVLQIVSDRKLDERVANEVMGLAGMSIVPRYSASITAAWTIVEKMVERYRSNPHEVFDWHGPIFKPKSRYLTREGYPLGTECWYVIVEVGGSRNTVCAETAPLAI